MYYCISMCACKYLILTVIKSLGLVKALKSFFHDPWKHLSLHPSHPPAPTQPSQHPTLVLPSSWTAPPATFTLPSSRTSLLLQCRSECRAARRSILIEVSWGKTIYSCFTIKCEERREAGGGRRGKWPEKEGGRLFTLKLYVLDFFCAFIIKWWHFPRHLLAVLKLCKDGKSG